MKSVCLLILFCNSILFFSGCKKAGCQGAVFNDPPPSPYTDPVWHPSGNLLGFNHSVLKSVEIDNSDCQKYYACTFYPDSTGFWLVDKDGSHMRRVTSFPLFTPSWSPDGDWIAFHNGAGVLYKMHFDGLNFDTSHIIQLTNIDGHKAFFPTWSEDAKTIFFDYDKDTPDGALFYSVWKMSSDGSNKERITDTAISVTNGGSRHPVYTTATDQIIYYQYPLGSQQMQLYTMNPDGSNGKRITDLPENFGALEQYNYFDNHIYLQNFGIWLTDMDGSELKKIIDPAVSGFSISKEGTIAYVNYSGTVDAVIDQTHGTIWVSDSKGSNPKPLTYNNY